VISYLIFTSGWLSTLAWQAGTASGPFLVGTIIQSLVSVSNPDYIGTNWQGTLMVLAITLITYLLTVWGAEAMPLFQNLMLVLHVFGFVIIVIVLWVLSPRNTADVVFTQLTNGGGWSTMGLSLMIGQISALYSLISTSDGVLYIPFTYQQRRL
jgi:choline transport protein